MSRSRVLRVVGMAAVVLCLSGCWGRVELNRLAVVDMLGIDLAPDGRLRVSAQIAIPGRLGGASSAGAGSGGSQAGLAPFFVLETEGDTLAEAFSFMQAKLPRRLFIAHVRVIVLGEGLSRAGIAPVVDSIARMREMRLSHDVVVTKGEASHLLRRATQLETLPGNALVSLLEQKVLPQVTVRDLILSIETPGIDPFVPWVALATPEVAEPQSPPAPPQSDVREPIEAVFEIAGIGVFRNDRLMGFVPRQEARGLSWLLNQIGRVTATFNWPAPGDSGHQPPRTASISSRLLRGDTKVRVLTEGGSLAVKLTVQSEDDIIANQAGLDLSNPEIVAEVERRLAEDVKQRIESIVRIAQDVYQSDIFGFGSLLHRQQPRIWRQVKDDWNPVFATLPVEIEVRAFVRRVGYTNQPAAGGRGMGSRSGGGE